MKKFILIFVLLLSLGANAQTRTIDSLEVQFQHERHIANIVTTVYASSYLLNKEFGSDESLLEKSSYIVAVSAIILNIQAIIAKRKYVKAKRNYLTQNLESRG